MLRNIIFLFFILIQFLIIANANIDVVYPSQKNTTINSDSTFIFGNTDANSKFYINSEPVKLWNNNFFVHTIPLKYGKNEVKFTSQNKGKEETVIYTITRPIPKKSVQGKPIIFKPKDENTFLYAKTVKENATVRSKPTKASSRIIDLPQNVILYLSGSKGNYYKIEESDNNEFWIEKSNISVPIVMHNRTKAILKKTKHYSDENYDYSKFYLSHPVLYTLKQNGNKIKLTLYGIETVKEDKTISPNLEYTFEYDTPIIGFDGYYEDGNFIFRHAKNPENELINPLKDIRIYVDAGHGGIDKGAVGPTRINEKDVNLKIANYLIEYLKEDEAQVSYTRLDDRKVSLNDRVKNAKRNNATISISIHNNSLPNGKNPYISHGTEVHYYNENAKLLADIIQKNLVKDLNLKDNGIHKSSFALNRATNPVSVLVEVAYMINPEEYILLQNDNFQKNVAKSIKNSIEKYILSVKKY